MKITGIIGLPASGKTYYAAQLAATTGALVYNTDDYLSCPSPSSQLYDDIENAERIGTSEIIIEGNLVLDLQDLEFSKIITVKADEAVRYAAYLERGTENRFAAANENYELAHNAQFKYLKAANCRTVVNNEGRKTASLPTAPAFRAKDLMAVLNAPDFKEWVSLSTGGDEADVEYRNDLALQAATFVVDAETLEAAKALKKEIGFVQAQIVANGGGITKLLNGAHATALKIVKQNTAILEGVNDKLQAKIKAIEDAIAAEKAAIKAQKERLKADALALGIDYAFYDKDGVELQKAVDAAKAEKAETERLAAEKAETERQQITAERDALAAEMAALKAQLAALQPKADPVAPAVITPQTAVTVETTITPQSIEIETATATIICELSQMIKIVEFAATIGVTVSFEKK
jgi:hypothetical protein